MPEKPDFQSIATRERIPFLDGVKAIIWPSDERSDILWFMSMLQYAGKTEQIVRTDDDEWPILKPGHEGGRVEDLDVIGVRTFPVLEKDARGRVGVVDLLEWAAQHEKLPSDEFVEALHDAGRIMSPAFDARIRLRDADYQLNELKAVSAGTVDQVIARQERTERLQADRDRLLSVIAGEPIQSDEATLPETDQGNASIKVTPRNRQLAAFLLHVVSKGKLNADPLPFTAGELIYAFNKENSFISKISNKDIRGFVYRLKPFFSPNT